MEENDKVILPHHEQQPLCTTRLPYRQGRKLTAVKVYSISNESNHLLIFGVPSLNLHAEAKALFIKFGKLQQFRISNDHVNEAFTKTYHAQYEKIQSARLAKRMLDTNNFYGGSLHVTYAPELESIEETIHKLVLRQQSVLYRLRNINKEEVKKEQEVVVVKNVSASVKLNMGEINTIVMERQNKRKKVQKNADNKRMIYTDNIEASDIDYKDITNTDNECMNNTDDKTLEKEIDKIDRTNINNRDKTLEKEIDIIDCTNVNNEEISNINEALNYNNFGNEIIRKVPEKSVNKIKFHINKNS